MHIKNLGLMEYADAYRLQKECVNQVLQGAAPALLLCEHPAVLTLGRMTKPENILWSDAELADEGVSVLKVDRGGDVTLHAPGQLVVYPILNLQECGKDLHRYLRRLEDVAQGTLRHFSITPRREPGQTGVWVDQKKVVSVGIGVKRWVTYHGIGINVNTDLSLFRMIKPCGLNVEMNSISHIIGQDLTMKEVAEVVVREFFNVFQDIKGVCDGAHHTA